MQNRKNRAMPGGRSMCALAVLALAPHPTGHAQSEHAPQPPQLQVVGEVVLGESPQPRQSLYRLESVFSSLADELSESEYSFDWEIRRDALLLASNLKLLAAESSSIADSDLYPMTFRATGAAEELATRWYEAEELSVLDFDDAFFEVANARHEVTAFAGSVNDLPVVWEYGPVYLIEPSATDRALEVFVRGENLDFDRPSLEIEGIHCALLDASNEELWFECPVDIFMTIVDWTNDSSPSAVVSGRLLTFGRPGFFSRRFGNKTYPVTYPVHLALLPSRLATVEVSASVATGETERFRRSQRVQFQNSDCKHARTSRWSIRPNLDEGWLIDVTSIQTRILKKSANATLNSIVRPQSTGFVVSATVDNTGACVGPFEIRQKPAFIEAEIIWSEVREAESRELQRVGTYELSWDETLLVGLPEGNQGFALSVRKSNGVTEYVTESGDFPWFSVSLNEDRTQLTVTPTEP